MDLSIESSRQFQTVVFFSQFVDQKASEEAGHKIYQSWSCSLSNAWDAFDENGPEEGDSLFFFNYYGKNLIQDAEGLHNELNTEEIIPKDQP